MKKDILHVATILKTDEDQDRWTFVHNFITGGGLNDQVMMKLGVSQKRSHQCLGIRSRRCSSGER